MDHTFQVIAYNNLLSLDSDVTLIIQNLILQVRLPVNPSHGQLVTAWQVDRFKIAVCNDQWVDCRFCDKLTVLVAGGIDYELFFVRRRHSWPIRSQYIMDSVKYMHNLKYLFMSINFLLYMLMNGQPTTAAILHRAMIVVEKKCYLITFYYRASICEGGLGSRNSVCPSVRLSVCHTCGLWQN